MSRNLGLSGMMGAGKTTVGRVVAERLGRRLADTDREIERWTGRTIADIVAQDGEGTLRELERRVVSELARQADLVMSLGGGVILDDRNVADLRASGVIVLLDVPTAVLAERLGVEAGTRPLLRDDAGRPDVAARLAVLWRDREAEYRAAADAVVSGAAAPTDVAAEVLAWAAAAGDVLTPSEHEEVAA
jgi:shikimate kinase